MVVVFTLEPFMVEADYYAAAYLRGLKDFDPRPLSGAEGTAELR